MAGGTPDFVVGEAQGTPDLTVGDSELLTEGEHDARAHSASRVTVTPSGLAVVTTTDVQAALEELDAKAAGALDESQSNPFGFGLIYTVDPMALASTQALSANQCIYARAVGGGLISKVGVYIGTQSGNISVAAYQNSGSGRNAVPGTRLATSGATACPAAGYAEVSLGASVGLLPGDWLALSCDNGTATFRGDAGGVLSADLFKGRCGQQGTAHPAPNTPSITAAGIRSICLVGVA